ncbi:hypothetical protein [Paenibacillus hemerocallicola]|uniref:hypothetical protein n=1 Tax=Paenibacillus hemerocallicola TaxID=1172614 RepID=UPI00159ED079|nr:hypothetical protein [Paenibacillus hemerocallicola]
MNRELPLKTDCRRPTGQWNIAGASLHNLKKVTVNIPTGVLTAVTIIYLISPLWSK